MAWTGEVSVIAFFFCNQMRKPYLAVIDIKSRFLLKRPENLMGMGDTVGKLPTQWCSGHVFT